MKKLFLTSLLIITALFTKALAQDCSFYFPTKVGTIVTTTYYDKKGKETSKLYQKVLDYKEGAGFQEVKVQNRTESKDSKDVPDSLLIHEFSIRCENGDFQINWDAYMGNTLDKYQGMDLEVNSENLSIPSKLTVGQTFPDAKIDISVTNQGVKLMTIHTVIKNRKVEAFEKLTTPAGTFDCVKLTSTTETKMAFIKVSASTAQWMAEGVGVVRTENYDKKGKLVSYSEITEIKE
ncbi:MAG: hypothetical protein L3J74_06845 [Bacteroidales bacterium]|nr:hypothetical protein [Bacteroidales bacterium]